MNLRKLPRMLAAMLTAALLLALCITPASAANIRVTVDGWPVSFTDAIPFVDENYRTMIPLRAAADALGCEVTWNQEVGTARIYMDDCVSKGLGSSVAYNDGYPFHWREDADITLYLRPGSEQVVYETTYRLYDEDKGEMIESGGGVGMFAMDTKPTSKNGRIYLPIRAIAETFGFSVAWDSASSTVIIQSDGTYLASVTSESYIEINAYPDWIGIDRDYQ